MELTAVLKSVVGPEFDRLPRELQAFHSASAGQAYIGTVTVRHGNWLAGLLSRIGGFPRALDNAPMRMSIKGTADGERWTRAFDGHVLCSTLRKSGDAHVTESFGMFSVTMCPVASETGLDMPVTGIRVLGVPVPSVFLGPSGGQETITADGSIQFCVASRIRGLGLLIEYKGTLALAQA